MKTFNSTGALFDLDGVLIDSESEYSKIWRTINEEYPTGIEHLEVVIKGCTLDKILKEYYPDPVIQEKVIKRLYELEGRMDYRFLPGAKELLDKLSEIGVPKVLVTSSNGEKMRHLYVQLPDMEDNFSFIITADLISHSKPHPEGYLLGASKIERDIKNCIVFEDSLQGVKAGRASGAFVVGVSGTLPEKVIEPYSDLVVSDLKDIDIVKLLEEVAERDE